MDPSAWFVTARFIDSRHPEGRQPLGVRHARRSGSNYTACGLGVLGWPIFWHLAFGAADAAEDETACADCARVSSGTARRRQRVA